MTHFPTLAELQENRQKIAPWIVRTPVWQLTSEAVASAFGNVEVFYKLELWQRAGSFKARGALTTLLHMDKATLQRGIVAASAGNHAIGVSYAGQCFGVSVKVLMPKKASPVRIKRCEDFGAEVILVENLAEAIQMMNEIAKVEGRTPIHPFEGFNIVLGTGSLGLEIAEQIENLDAVIVPVGGGGLSAGIANAIKMLKPNCQVFGVEPSGADAIYKSCLEHKVVVLEKVHTIAASLAVPGAMPYTLELVEKKVDEIVRIEDSEMIAAMKWLFYQMKLAVEPAAAATTAALMGVLRERLQGKRVCLLLSGTNIDLERYNEIIASINK